MLEHPTIRQSDSIELFKEKLGNNFEYQFLPNEEPIVISEIGKINNFTLVDGVAFRYERESTPRNACIEETGSYTNAVGALHDAVTAELLKEIFNDNYNTETLN